MFPVDPTTYDASDGFLSMKPPRTYPHTGIDFIVPTGTTVVAVKPGMVTATGFDSGNGNYVAQSLPDGRYWSYIHLSSISVRVGDRLTEGTVIGLSGNTGTNTRGPHLHCSLSDSGRVYVGQGNLSDPWVYLNELPPIPPGPTRKRKRMFSMAAVKGEGYVWAVWAPGFYYEIKKQTGQTDAQVIQVMERWNAQVVGAPNFEITRAQANEIKALCLR